MLAPVSDKRLPRQVHMKGSVRRVFRQWHHERSLAPPPPPLDGVVRFQTSGSPSSRAIFALQRLPEDIGQGIAIPRGPTTPEEGLRGTLWSSLHSFGDFNAYQRHNSKGDSRLPPVDGDLFDTSYGIVGQLDDRQHVRSMWSVELEQMAARNSTLGNRGALQGGRDDSKGIGGE